MDDFLNSRDTVIRSKIYKHIKSSKNVRTQLTFLSLKNVILQKNSTENYILKSDLQILPCFYRNKVSRLTIQLVSKQFYNFNHYNQIKKRNNMCSSRMEKDVHFQKLMQLSAQINQYNQYTIRTRWIFQLCFQIQHRE